MEKVVSASPGDAEEPLNLVGVQVQRDVPVGPSDADHVGDEAGGDGHPGLVLFIRPRVGQVRDDRRNPVRGCPTQRVQEDEQFHDILVHGRGSGLNQEDVLPANAFVETDEDVLVGEPDDVPPGEGDSQVVADLLGQFRATATAEQFDHAVHPPPLG
jgi:hypothetical protein